MGVNCDNQVAIGYMKDPKYYGRTKHIDNKNALLEILQLEKK